MNLMQRLIKDIFKKLCPSDILSIFVTDETSEIKEPNPENITIVYSENIGMNKGYHFYDFGDEHIKYNSDAYPIEGAKEHVLDSIRFALIKDNVVYLLFEVSDNGKKFLESVLNTVLPELIERAIEKRKHNFKNAYAKAIDTKVKEFKDDIEQNKYDALQKEKELLTLQQKIVMDSLSMQAIEGTVGQWKQKAESEFNHLMKLVPNQYKDVYLSDGEIVALSYHVEITYNHYTYDIGEFDIRIKLESGDVVISNLTHRLDDQYDHPHILDGAACLGNIGKGITKMLAEFEFFGALQLINMFLHSYNPSSPYHKIEYWDPDYQDEEDDRYESCHESSSGYTCVECGDGECPFYEYAYETCFNNSDLDDCTNCEYQCRLGRQ